jgi:hypothetical protein
VAQGLSARCRTGANAEKLIMLVDSAGDPPLGRVASRGGALLDDAANN